MADRVSMALCQEADVRRNHEFFNGRNAARTPLSTVGHQLPVATSTQPPFERLVRSVTRRMVYASNSASADGGPSIKNGRFWFQTGH